MLLSTGLNTWQVALLIFVPCINAWAYASMWYDKRSAVKKRRRIPEARLWLLALLLGAPGIYLGMKKPLYHKAARSVFVYGIPLLIVANVATLYIAWHQLTSTRL